MYKTKILLALIIFSTTLFGQNNLLVLKTNTKVLSVKDGNQLRANYWTLDPNLDLDVYETNKTNQITTVGFYSDIDSISFQVHPREAYNFLVVYNDTDTFKTQIKSGLTFVKTADMSLDQDTIPFVLTKANNIIIQTILNKNDTLDLMFHTAQNAISLTEEAVKKITNKNFDKTVRSESWGGEHNARYSEGNAISIQDFEWKNVTLWEDKNTGPTADGKFGPNLFDNKVIELNFDKNIMVIHSYMPEISKDYQKANLRFRRSSMFVETHYKIENKDYQNDVMLHSGYGGTILLDDKYVADNNIAAQLKIISESHLKDSYGNILKTKTVILPYFSMGTSSFQDMPISFFEGIISNQSVSVMGGNLIKRFNIFFDLQNAHIYYKANDLNGLPFEDS